MAKNVDKKAVQFRVTDKQIVACEDKKKDGTESKAAGKKRVLVGSNLTNDGKTYSAIINDESKQVFDDKYGGEHSKYVRFYGDTQFSPDGGATKISANKLRYEVCSSTFTISSNQLFDFDEKKKDGTDNPLYGKKKAIISVKGEDRPWELIIDNPAKQIHSVKDPKKATQDTLIKAFNDESFSRLSADGKTTEYISVLDLNKKIYGNNGPDIPSAVAKEANQAFEEVESPSTEKEDVRQAGE